VANTLWPGTSTFNTQEVANTLWPQREEEVEGKSYNYTTRVYLSFSLSLLLLLLSLPHSPKKIPLPPFGFTFVNTFGVNKEEPIFSPPVAKHFPLSPLPLVLSPSPSLSLKRRWSPRKMGGREFFGTFTQIDYKLWTGTT
jgi:hypothetical protein